MNRSLMWMIGLIEMSLAASAYAGPKPITVPDSKNPALSGLTDADSGLLLSELQSAGAKPGPDGSVSVSYFACRPGFDLGRANCTFVTPERTQGRIQSQAVARLSLVLDAVWRAAAVKAVDRAGMSVGVQCAANGAECVFSFNLSGGGGLAD